MTRWNGRTGTSSARNLLGRRFERRNQCAPVSRTPSCRARGPAARERAEQLWASPGTSSSTPENSRGPSTSTVSGVSAVTVAVRGPLSSSDISPKYAAGSERGDLAAVALDLHLALDEHEALAADLALAHEHRARRACSTSSDARAIRCRSLLRARGEQRDRCQVIEVLIPAGHVPLPIRAAPRRAQSRRRA